MNNRSMEDEIMVQEIGKTANVNKSIMCNSRVVIYDARPKMNAQANRLKNGGFETNNNYKNSEIIFCDIDNIHAVSKAFEKMYDIIQAPENFQDSTTYN